MITKKYGLAHEFSDAFIDRLHKKTFLLMEECHKLSNTQAFKTFVKNFLKNHFDNDEIQVIITKEKCQEYCYVNDVKIDDIKNCLKFEGFLIEDMSNGDIEIRLPIEDMSNSHIEIRIPKLPNLNY